MNHAEILANTMATARKNRKVSFLKTKNFTSLPPNDCPINIYTEVVVKIASFIKKNYDQI